MTKIWERQIAIFLIVAALVGMLVCAGLFIQAYITHKPALELLAYSSATLLLSGYLALIIASNISTLIGTEKKRLSYIAAFIGAILLSSSFGLSFVGHKPGSEWWEYSSTVTFGTGFINMTLYTLVDTERKRLRGILQFITFLLMLTTFVLTFLDLLDVFLNLLNEDAIAISTAFG